MFIITLARVTSVTSSYFLKGSGPCLQIYLCQFSLKVDQVEFSAYEKQAFKIQTLCTKHFVVFNC